jgi:hypothetical protein
MAAHFRAVCRPHALGGARQHIVAAAVCKHDTLLLACRFTLAGWSSVDAQEGARKWGGCKVTHVGTLRSAKSINAAANTRARPSY